MDIKKRTEAFAELGKVFNSVSGAENCGYSDILEPAIQQAFINNGWFTEKNVRTAFKELGTILTTDNLTNWVQRYSFNKTTKNIGVISAGNIPLSGFHDFMCVLISGNKYTGKLSGNDNVLLPAISKILCSINSGFESFVSFNESALKTADAIIATGSNNSSRYFEYYFSKYPHIIRKHRNAVAVLTGKESAKELTLLGKDIFLYFGLGCRNVSKLFIPVNYDFNLLFQSLYEYSTIIENKKYVNNYEYNRTIYLMNKEKILDNNFLILKEDIAIASPVAVLYYEFYSSTENLADRIQMDKNNIQCLIGNVTIGNYNVLAFGQAQSPGIEEYADNIDTLQFIASLSD